MNRCRCRLVRADTREKKPGGAGTGVARCPGNRARKQAKVPVDLTGRGVIGEGTACGLRGWGISVDGEPVGRIVSWLRMAKRKFLLKKPWHDPPLGWTEAARCGRMK